MTLTLPTDWLGALRDLPIAREIAGPAPRRGLTRILPPTVMREAVALDHRIREGRFQRALALIASGSALLGGLEVAYEHVQGSYSQRIMYSPVFLSGGVAVAGAWSVANRRVARTLLPLASCALLADCVIGFVFHVRGIARKPGGWRIPVTNVVMGPPLFAPLLLGISGLLGLIASGLRREDDPRRVPLSGVRRSSRVWRELVPRRLTREGLLLEQHVREGRIQRLLAAATAASALFNGLEALYSHYRGAYAYRSQWIPILLSPIVTAAASGTVVSRSLARTALPLASAAALASGMYGLVVHGRGILRRPGGLKHPIYNLVYGPPIFAPLLYAATGFLGLLASLLRRAD